MQEQNYSPLLSSQLSEWRRSHGAGGSARETAYQILRDKIIQLEVKPGEPLSDKKLAEELNMSRTPVREALILLSSSNMVVLRPQIGTYVAPIDVERMEMEQFSRYVMEKEIVARACGKLGEELRWRYEENLRAYGHYSALRDERREPRLLELDNEFHRIAYTAAGRENNFFQLLGSLQHVERMRILSLRGLDTDQTLSDHEQLSRAILAGDTASALSTLERHLSRYRDNLAALQEKYPEYFTLGR